jgi:hypothetical protein
MRYVRLLLFLLLDDRHRRPLKGKIQNKLVLQIFKNKNCSSFVMRRRSVGPDQNLTTVSLCCEMYSAE